MNANAEPRLIVAEPNPLDGNAEGATAEEVVVALTDGWTLRSGVYDPDKPGAFVSGEYVRLCRPDGEEYLYWDQEEWENDPSLVMGAIMNAAAGRRLEA